MVSFVFNYTINHWEFGIGFYAGGWSNPPSEYPWAFYMKPEISLMFGPFSVGVQFGESKDEDIW